MISSLFKYVGKYKKVTILTPVFAALEVFMETLIPFITANMIDEGITPGIISNVFKYGLIMIGIAFCSLTFAIFCARYAAMASTGFAANIRKALYSHIQDFSFANIDKFSTAGLITRMTTDVTNVQNAFQMSIRMAVRAPLTLISSMIMCLFISPKMSLVFVAAIAILIIAFFLLVPKVIRVFTQVFKKYDALNSSVQENVSAIRVVKAFVREDFESEKFSGAAKALYDLSVKAEKRMAIVSPLMMIVVHGAIIAISWLGAHLIVAGEFTTGELTSMFSYVTSIFMSLMMLMAVIVMITMSAASAKRIAEVFDEEPSIKNPSEPVCEITDGSIIFNDVDFSYSPTQPEKTLKNININIKSGETIGIIGGTGSGKSTLVSLISRLYDVSSGSVIVGGYDVKDYDLETLRNKVSVVLQKNVLFSGTVLDNLRWGNPDATEEECKKACDIACISDFIEQQPEGYGMHIEQGGTNVSGGQRQRLCIARALMKSPKVLVLDDSTSAVDTATDARIRKAFAEFIPDTTKLIIAQRIASVMNTDRIIVLSDGEIAGFDTHENLLKTNDIYKEIYETQMSAGGDFDEPAAM